MIASDSTPFGRGLASRFSQGVLSRRFHRSISSSIKSPTRAGQSCRSVVPRASFTSGTRHHKSRGSSSRRSVPTEGGLGHAPLGRWRRRRPAPRVELAKACCRVFVHLQEGVPPSYARLSRRPSGRPSGRAASTRPSASPAGVSFGRTFQLSFPRGPTPSCLKRIHTRDWT